MQEVWRGRLPRLGVVNSIGRKKFSAVLALLEKVHLVGLVSVTKFLKNLGSSIKFVMVEPFGQVAAVVGEVVVQSRGKGLENVLIVRFGTGCIHEEPLVAESLYNPEEIQFRRALGI